MTEPVRPDELRVSDVERAAVQERLRRAVGEFVHPWWLYVAAPPGAVLGVLYAFGIGRPNS